MASKINRFLINHSLVTDLSNISTVGETNIINIIDDKYINPATGKIYGSLLPGGAINNVSTYPDIATRDASGPFNTGDVSIILPPLNETYIFDGVAWVEILVTESIFQLSDVGQLGFPPADGDILEYSTINSKFLNTPTLRNHINLIEEHFVYPNKLFLQTIDQNLAITDSPTFKNLSVNEKYQITAPYVNTVPVNGDMWLTNNDIGFHSGGNNINLSLLETDRHTHANKTQLDSINQLMSTSSQVTFNTISNNNKLLFLTSIPDPPLTDIGFYRKNNDIWMSSNGVQVDLTASQHNHANKSNLDSINQDLSTGDNVTFNIANLFRSAYGPSFRERVITTSDTGGTYEYSGVAYRSTNSISIHADVSADVRFTSTTIGTDLVPILNIDKQGLKLQPNMNIYKPVDIVVKETPGSTNQILLDTLNGSVFCSNQLTCGIGAIATSYNLYVSNLNASPDGQWSDYGKNFDEPSDSRLKRNISNRDSENIYDRISSLEVKNYKYRYSNNYKVGLIAQDLEANIYYNQCVKVGGNYNFRDVVTDTDETITNLKSINTELIDFDIIVAVQKLIAENQELRTRIGALESVVF